MELVCAKHSEDKNIKACRAINRVGFMGLVLQE
jgi:hypothetical protein